METVNQIWSVIAPYLAGISVAGVVSTIFYAILNAAFRKTVNKIDVKKIVKESTDKGIEQVKEVTFKHSIQPVVNSELVKINEKADEHLEKAIQRLEKGYDKLVNVIDKLGAFYDDSMIPNEKKEAFKQAVKEALTDNTQEVILESDVIVEDKKETKKETKKNDYLL